MSTSSGSRRRIHIHGQLMLVDAERPKHVTLRRGTVVLDDNKIAEVVVDDQPSQFDFGGPDYLIAPGLVDTHLHLPQFDMIGAHGLPLLQWLAEHTFPAEVKWKDLDYATAMTHRVIDQCFSHGTTTIAAYATSDAQSARSALTTARQRGIAGVIGQVWMDRNGPDALLGDAASFTESTAEAIEDAHPRMNAAITPRFAVSCTQELLKAAGQLASEKQAIIQTHLSETRAECDLVRELFDGLDYVTVYESAGLMTDRAILGHGIHLTDPERQRIASLNAHVAHCPTANSFLRSGVMHRHAHLAANVSICLGSDIGAGYERSMVRVARSMIEAAAIAGGDLPSATHGWWQITHGNHAVLFPDRTSGLVAGSDADVVLIQPDVHWEPSSPSESLSRLMFAWDDRWVKQTMAAGRIVYPTGA
ncbi:MAG: amidohydrolase family protein [Planctomycetota bacterium]